MKRFLLLILLCPALALGATYDDEAKTALTDGTVSDTQAAVDYIDAKNEDGWILTIGSAGGTYTWASALSISIEHVVTIQGASPTNRPTIDSTYVGSIAISISLTDGKLFTLKDIKFDPFAVTLALIKMTGSGVDTFRLTNLKFLNWSSARCVTVGNDGGTHTLALGPEGPYGVIDNCELYGEGAGFYFMEYPENWRRPMTWGTKYAFFVEDCTFTSASVIAPYPDLDGWNGCRVVYRYNNSTNRYIGTHGPDTAGRLNSALQGEFNHNTFTVTNGLAIASFILNRIGTSVITGNTFTRTGSGMASFTSKNAYHRGGGDDPAKTGYDRFYTALSTTIAAGSNGAELPQATINVASSSPLPTNFAAGFKILVTTSAGVQTVTCGDSNGTQFTGCSGGTGTMSTGGAVTRASDYLGTMQPGSGYVGTPGQDPHWPDEPWGSVPMYHWNNTVTFTPTFNPPTGVSGLTGGFVEFDRDIFLSARPGYTEYTYPHPLRTEATPSPPVNTSLPLIVGLTFNGEILTATDGAWTGSPTPTYTKQWRRCNSSGASCSDLSGETGTTYTLVSGDIGNTIRVVVTATNTEDTVPATSAQTSVVDVPVTPPINLRTRPTIARRR